MSFLEQSENYELSLCVNASVVRRWTTSSASERPAQAEEGERRFSCEYPMYFSTRHHSPSDYWSNKKCFLPKRRVVMLNSEMDKGIQVWKDKLVETRQQEEQRKSQLFKPKGKLLKKKNTH